jgi:DNA-binding NtrC family response regulator
LKARCAGLCESHGAAARKGCEYTHMHILVIDDDRAIRDSLRITLEYEGYEIADAATGREGLALVRRETPDLVLLDVEMPGMNGLEVLKGLHTTHQSLPVVLMSAHGVTAIVVEAMRAGAVDFLEKPFENTDRLRTTIHSAIEQARLLG